MTEQQPAKGIGDGVELSIGELAERAGITRRVVRFYVQRELIAPPHGRGRGSYYTADHLRRVLRIQELQAEGLSLDAIGELLDRAQDEGQENVGAADSHSPVSAASVELKMLREPVDLMDAAGLDVVEPEASKHSAPKHIQRRARAKVKKRAQQSDEMRSVDSHSVNSESVDSDSGESGSQESRSAEELWQRVSLLPGLELNVDITKFQFNEEDKNKLKKLVIQAVTGLSKKAKKNLKGE